jgi:bromodomain-containing protein 7/9
MDFSTMKKKIGQDDYSNIIEFRADFELMCENAMKYNRPDTIYWQAAKKLLAAGSKLLNKEKLLSFRRSVECFSHLTERELGFRIDSSSHSIDDQPTTSNEQQDSSLNDSDQPSSINVSQTSSQRKPKLILKLPKFYEKAPVVVASEEPQPEEEDDELPPEEILAQAQLALRCAQEKLALRPPISYTLDYQRENNSTSLCYLNQDDDTQQLVKINDLNESSTTSSLPIVNENEKRNELLSKHFLENGPFSSNASQYDSPFTSVSKEELDLLIHTYGSEFSAQYAVSLMNYVKDSGDLALAYVDRFLSVLTNGEHDNFILKTREKQPKEEEVEADDDTKMNEANSSLTRKKLSRFFLFRINYFFSLQ